MRDIAELDKNFAPCLPDETGTVWYDCLQPPFRVYGLLHTPQGFVRMPLHMVQAVPTLTELNTHTAGGRVRFATDADSVSVQVQLRNVGKMPHFALTGSAGMDLYADGVHAGTFQPPFDVQESYSAKVQLRGSGLREMELNLPLYSGVVRLAIGLPAGARLCAGRPYACAKPVVYYGSSITQGGCASRPGNSYESIVSRRLGYDYVNLGFSGNARAEDAMADYVAGLDMAAFVYDYDHNAPDVAHLQRTHARMFATVRAKNPTLPILLMTRPDPAPIAETFARRAVIMRTYTDALAAGDANVYFLDGRSFVEEGDGTVDGCHPNDLGFARMAQAVYMLLRQVLPPLPAAEE